MENIKNITIFVRFCAASAKNLDLGLSSGELIRLHEECLEIAKYYNDISTLIISRWCLVILCNSLSRHVESLSYLKELIPVVSEHDTDSDQLAAYALFTSTFEYLGNNDEATIFADKLTEMEIYLCLGRAYLELKKYDESLTFNRRSLDIAVDINDTNGKVQAYMSMIDVFWGLRQHEKAILCATSCLGIAEQTSDRQTAMEACFLLRKIYADLKQYDMAVLYCEKCLGIAEEEKNKNGEMKAYSFLGESFLRLKNYDRSISCGRKCIEIAKKIGDKQTEMDALLVLGEACIKLQMYDDAVVYGNECIEIAKKIGDKQTEMDALLVLGEACIKLQMYDDAVVYGNECIEIAKETNDRKATEMIAYSLLGRAFSKQVQYDRAIMYGKKCAYIAEELDHEVDQITFYLFIGTMYVKLGKYDNAIRYLNQCIDLSAKCGIKDTEACARSILGSLYHSLNRYDYAVSCIAVLRETGEEIRLNSISYSMQGKVNMSLKKYDDAVLCFRKCIEFAKANGDVKEELKSRLNLGETYILMKRYDVAAEVCKECTDLAKEAGEKSFEAKACIFLSSIFLVLKRTYEALSYGTKSLGLVKDAGDEETEVYVHLILAETYKILYQLHLFSAHTNVALALAEKLRDNDAKTKCIQLLFEFYFIIGMHEKANTFNAPLYEELHEVPTCSEQDLLYVLDQTKKTNDRHAQRMALYRLCKYYKHIHRYEEAIQCLKELITLQLGNDMELYCHTVIIRCCVCLKQYDRALDYCQVGVALAKQCQDKIGKSRFYSAVGQVYLLAFSQLELAEEYLRKAMLCFEMIFESLSSHDEFKISILDEYANCYKLLSQVLIKSNRVQEALLVSDRCRSRALNDLLTTTHGVKQVESDDLAHAEALAIYVCLKKFSILFYSLLDDTLTTFLVSSGIVFSFSMVNFVSSEISLLQMTDRAFDEMDVRHVVSCEDRSLDSKQENSKRRYENSLPQRRTPYDPKPQASGKKDESNFNMALKDLYSILVGHVKEFVNQDEIIIIPEGPLYKVPFAALKDPDTEKYLSETYRIRLVPSIVTLAFLSDSAVDTHYKTGALIIGDPLVGKVVMNGVEREDINPLESAHAEAIVIAHKLGVRPLIGEEATKPAVIEKLREGVSVVHIAAHGNLEKAAILLAPSPEIRATKIPDEEDYMLTMADVQQAQVRAQLVVLSCCHSGRGEIRAEGVVGMCRAFLASGARAVVASLWAIDDDATLTFMSLFYHNLKKGESASKSLQLTMNDMRKCKSFKEPKYWAPFFIIGDDVTIYT